MTGKPSRPAGIAATPVSARSACPLRTRSISRSEPSSSSDSSTPGWAAWNADSASNIGLTVQAVTMRDHEPAAQQAGDFVDGLPDRAGRGEDRAGVFERRRAGGCERRRACRPVDQLGAELLLEPSHLRADPGLADVHTLGRAGEVRLLGDGHEVLELPQLHNH